MKVMGSSEPVVGLPSRQVRLAQQAGCPAGDHNCAPRQYLLCAGQRERAQLLIKVAEG